MLISDHAKKEKLRKLSESWSYSIKRNSEDAAFIDALNVSKKKSSGLFASPETPKPLVPAPPNRLERGDFSEDSDEEEKEKCEFIDDEAEVML